MKLIDEAQAFLKPSGSARSATLVMLVMWAIATIWGWFFVEPTVLRDSPAARDYVDFASRIFPWLNSFRSFGLLAEKAFFLHSVLYLAVMPGVLLSMLQWLKHLPNEQRGPLKVKSIPLRCFAVSLLAVVLAVLIAGIYFELLRPSGNGQLHRAGYSLAISPVSVPITASFIAIGLWTWFLTLVFSIFQIFRKKKKRRKLITPIYWCVAPCKRKCRTVNAPSSNGWRIVL